MRTAAVKQGARQNKPVRNIIDEAKKDLSDEQLVLIKNNHALEMRVSRERKKLGFHPDELDKADLMDFIVPDEFKTTSDGKCFLIFDSRDSQNFRSPSRSPTRSPGRSNIKKERSIVFCSPEGLQLLANQKHWAIDWTFKAAPSICRQTKAGQLFIIGLKKIFIYFLKHFSHNNFRINLILRCNY